MDWGVHPTSSGRYLFLSKNDIKTLGILLAINFTSCPPHLFRAGAAPACDNAMHGLIPQRHDYLWDNSSTSRCNSFQKKNLTVKVEIPCNVLVISNHG